ncbi:MAG: TolC family protein [Acidobacteria bacterium]|nr:TolC family protein [Acidobacteriota bacterium]
MSRHRSRRSACPALGGGLLAILLILPAAAAAGTPPTEPGAPFAPVRLTSSTITLENAVSIALHNDPGIYLAREQAYQRLGTLQQAKGSFDLGIELTPSFEHQSSPVTPGQSKNEWGKRLLMNSIATVFQRIADGLEEQLASDVLKPVTDCVDTTIEFGTQRFDVICPPEDRQVDVLTEIELARDRGKLDIEDRLRQSFRREFQTLQVSSSLIAYVGRVLLRALGLQPTIQDRETLSLDLAFPKLYRTGISLTPQIMLEGVKDNYRGRPLNPTYGGKGNLNSYTARLGLSLDIPLGKGRGIVSTGAPEVAAGYSYDSSLETVAHTMSDSVQRTLIAYWNVVGAQQSLALLQQSAGQEAELVKIGEDLADGGEIAPADLVYVRARLEATRGTVSQARQALLQARVSLAKTIGLSVERLDDTPLASGDFPPPPSAALIQSWRSAPLGRAAVARRSDVLAAHKLADAAKVLADAARADLKRESTLSFTVFYSGLFESPEPMDARNFGRGYYDALFSNFTGPSALITLNFNLPFRNNVALGRYEQSRALQLRSEITAGNLERVVSARVEELIGTVARATDSIARHEAAAASYRQTLEDETEKFKAGESSVVDVVLTEEREISERLQLVSARLRLATLMAQFRYEMGTLVDYRIEDGQVVVTDVWPTGQTQEGMSETQPG